jgi:hypothetical protein
MFDRAKHHQPPSHQCITDFEGNYASTNPIQVFLLEQTRRPGFEEEKQYNIYFLLDCLDSLAKPFKRSDCHFM